MTFAIDTLYNYLDGEKTQDIFDVDDSFLKEVAALQQTEQLLREAYERADCPSPETLLLIFDKIENDDLVVGHVERCAFCKADMVALRQQPSYPPPATSWFSKLLQGGKQLLMGTAVQSEKSRLALRGDEETILTFNAEPFNLSVSKESIYKGVWQIKGQILENGEIDENVKGKVFLLQNDAPVSESPIGMFGYFEHHDIAEGEYTLVVELHTNILVTSSFALK